MSACAGDKMSFARTMARPSKKKILNKRNGFVSGFDARRAPKAKGERTDEKPFRVTRSRFNRIVEMDNG